jgi:hypothetical protein
MPASVKYPNDFMASSDMHFAGVSTDSYSPMEVHLRQGITSNDLFIPISWMGLDASPLLLTWGLSW